MPAPKHYFILTVLLIIVVCVNLVNAHPVLADGETPPEPPAATETAAEPSVESAPEPVEAAATPVAEALTQVPESTDVIVLDENGSSVPLATQEAAEITAVVDPIWCPAGVLPGGAGCSTSYSTIIALVNNMRDNPSDYDEHGVIYFTTDPGTQSFSLTDDGASLGSSFDTLKNFNLTLQGGWNGDLISPSLSGPTNFGTRPITIGSDPSAGGNPWVGNLTLNDFTFTGSSLTSVTVYTTTGNITLSNVDVNDQGNGKNTALLSSTSGNITVSDGTYDGNNSNTAGFSATTGGSITITDSSFTENKKPNNGNGNPFDDSYDGATLSAPVVTLANVTANDNDGNGITINNANVVTLNNVTANGNGTEITPTGLTNNVGSGVFFSGNVGSSLIVNGGTFNNNQRYGIELGNPANTIIYIQAVPTCTGNDSNAAPTSSCSNGTFVFDTTAPTLLLPANITREATGSAGAVVTYSASATDNLDGSVPANCSPASGSTFALGTTTVNCSVVDTAGNPASGSFQVTVQDTTPPTLSLPADITANVSDSSAVVTYSAPASDIVSGSTSANCVPASGASFSVGATTVNCSASDAAGNIALGSFKVTVVDTTVVIPTLPPGSPSSTPPASTSQSSSSTSQSNSSPLIIPLTGGVIDLDCNSAFWAFGIKLSFMNLCDHQTVLNSVGINDLPGNLPNGYSYVLGLDLSILNGDQSVEDLPDGAGIQIDFPISGGAKDQFAVLYWNGSAWTEVSQLVSSAEVSQVMSGNPDDEFYQVQNGSAGFYQILTTGKIGIFVLVKK